MRWTKETAEKRLSDFKMEDMSLIPISPQDTKIAPDWFQKYKQTRKEFMNSLTDSIQEIAFIGISQDDFMGLITGKRMPPGYSIRFRIPMMWGGEISVDNMFMCKTFPQSQNLDRFILEQSDNELIWLPNPAKKIYIPIHNVAGGDGGNATEDRLAQLAAQLAQVRES